jgi:hypothetical protein
MFFAVGASWTCKGRLRRKLLIMSQNAQLPAIAFVDLALAAAQRHENCA